MCDCVELCAAVDKFPCVHHSRCAACAAEADTPREKSHQSHDSQHRTGPGPRSNQHSDSRRPASCRLRAWQ